MAHRNPQRRKPGRWGGRRQSRPTSGKPIPVNGQFHTTFAAALLADDPEPLFEAACAEAPPSEATDLRYLFDQHLELWGRDPHPVTPIRTEYQMGLTLTVPGQTLNRQDKLDEGPVAVVMMCATDVNGWENDTTAAVIEHRTGASGQLPRNRPLRRIRLGSPPTNETKHRR